MKVRAWSVRCTNNCMQRGFSLVETIVATSLLAAALVALAQLVDAGVQSGAAARARAATTLMAEQKMEQLRALPWATLATIAPDATDYLDMAGDEQCGAAHEACGDAVYVRRWSAIPASFSSAVLILEVDVHLVGKGHGSTTLVSARARMTP
jgi:prepilin-type N-terminal cleavage/methylation domain-containing protein